MHSISGINQAPSSQKWRLRCIDQDISSQKVRLWCINQSISSQKWRLRCRKPCKLMGNPKIFAPQSSFSGRCREDAVRTMHRNRHFWEDAASLTADELHKFIFCYRNKSQKFLDNRNARPLLKADSAKTDFSTNEHGSSQQTIICLPNMAGLQPCNYIWNCLMLIKN